jgi:hypothetical protein
MANLMATLSIDFIKPVLIAIIVFTHSKVTFQEQHNSSMRRPGPAPSPVRSR